ncbi:MAG: choice-of-anchor D domain-containing protein [bacterium]
MARHADLLALALIVATAIVLPGCGGDSEGTNEPSDPVCDIDVQSLAFGSVTVGDSSDLVFRITNAGGGTLAGTVSQACAEFSVVGEADYSLGSGDTATITVRFAPTSVGAKTCNVSTGASCAEVACTGTGDLEPVCDLSLSELDFGTVFVGYFKDTTFTLTNNGGGILVGEVYTSHEAFSVVGVSEFGLGAGQAATFTIRFAPLSDGLAECEIDMDSEFCGPIICAGVGETPQPCSVDPSGVNFGSVEVGETTYVEFTIHNPAGPTFSGTVSSPCSEFPVVGEADYSLDSGEMATFAVGFAPASAGAKACTLDTGAPGCADFQCAGYGVITVPICRVSPAVLPFSVVFIGSHLDKTFTITNIGGGTLSGSVSESSDDFSIVSGADYSLAAGDSAVVTVRFAPTFEGDISCTTSTGGSCAGVRCGGVGAREPVCDMSATSLDFGTVMIGNHKDETFTITNTGGWYLGGLVEPSCPDLSVIEADEEGFGLGADESVTFTARFSPSGEGRQDCTIYLHSEYCGDIACTGTGASGPVCEVEPDTLDFGFAEAGGSVDLALTIRNTVGNTMTGAVSSPCSEFSIVGSAFYSIDQGDSATFTVRFTPATLGVKACTIETGSGVCVDVQATGGGAPHGDYYVHASSGADINPGTVRAPFKTVTHAVTAAGPGKTICVLPGIYDAALGETFPIRLQQGQSLLGDVANKGVGPDPTTIYGAGYAGPGWDGDYLAALVAADGSSIAGLRIGAAYATKTHGIYLVNAIATISDNTLASVTSSTYGGVYATGDVTSTIVRNNFLTVAYGLYSYHCQGAMVVEDNLFETMAIPINIMGSANNTIIRENTFVGSGQNGVLVQQGIPVIEDNTFNNPDGYSNYGAVSCQSPSSNPRVRGNTFACARGVRIENGHPDLGTAGDLGGNGFSGVSGAAIYNIGTTSVSAIGNTWAHTPPVCGSDIVITASGSVTWGTGPGQSCP